ncbi:MAG: hypothetical protein Q8920_14295 [Bacillota bacterium]|nr:hypothetical protein [Bacillota bacterium]
MEFETRFDVNKVSFSSVSEEFRNKYLGAYRKSLKKMSDDKNGLDNASGANSLGILEKMGRQMAYYNKASDFEQSYHELMKEYEPFTET